MISRFVFQSNHSVVNSLQTAVFSCQGCSDALSCVGRNSSTFRTIL